MKDNMEGQTFSAWSYLSNMDCQFGTLGFKASLVFQNGLRIQHDSYVDVLHECKTEEKEKNPRKLSWKYLPVLMAVIALILCNVLFVIMRGTSDDQGTYVLPWRHKAHIICTDMGDQIHNKCQNYNFHFRYRSQTTLYIRMDQFPNEIFVATRSQILRKFRRFTQTMLLELIYKSRNQSMPMNPYKDSPPGWSEYKPDIEFRNISNSRTGEEEIFNKMVFLLQNKSEVPLPSDWEVLLEHYKNLNEKQEQEESKKALVIWMRDKKLIPQLQEYSKEVDVPSEEIAKYCFAIFRKSRYFQENKWYINDKQQCQVKLADEELSKDEMLSGETSQNKESLEPRAKISECTIALNQQYGENQSMEIPHSLQRHLSIMENIDYESDNQWIQTNPEEIDLSTFSSENPFLSSDFDPLQQVSSKDNLGRKRRRLSEESTSRHLNIREDMDYESSYDQLIQTNQEEIDLSTFSPENPFLSSDCDPLQQVSSKDNLGINPVPSESNPCFKNMNTSCYDNQDTISNLDILSEKDYDEIALDFYEPAILLKYLQKYLKDLGNNRPSPRMVTLCNDILKKDREHINLHKDFFQRL